MVKFVKRCNVVQILWGMITFALIVADTEL